MSETLPTKRPSPKSPSALGWKPIKNEDSNEIEGWVNAEGRVILVSFENVGIWGSRYVKRYSVVGQRFGRILRTFDRFIDAHKSVGGQ
jgi:hypothetical protein